MTVAIAHFLEFAGTIPETSDRQGNISMRPLLFYYLRRGVEGEWEGMAEAKSLKGTK